jgi:hypothetical protein
MGGDYRQIITRWERYFGSEQILYLSYDDLADEPEGRVGNVCHFLGIDPERIRGRDTVSAWVNVADQKLDIPKVVRDTLRDRYLGQVEFLEAKPGCDLRQWK